MPTIGRVQARGTEHEDSSKTLLLGLFIVAMLAAVVVLPVREWLTAALIWTESHRYLAWVLFMALYLVATVLVIPGTILTLAAGFAFGVPVGAILVSVGSLAGACAAFLVGRFFAREWVQERIANWRTFGALDKAAGQEGFVIVLLSRLSPLFPFQPPELCLRAYGGPVPGLPLRLLDRHGPCHRALRIHRLRGAVPD